MPFGQREEKSEEDAGKALTNLIDADILNKPFTRGALLEAESFGGDRAEAGRTRGAG